MMMNKIYNKMIALSLTAVLMVLASCSQDAGEYTNENGAKLFFHIYDGNTTRAVTDGKSMVTTFEQADKAGLYAVKGGQVVLNNVPLVYSVNGFWEADEAIKVSDELNGAQFYAYYPYSEEAQFDATAANPFQTMVTAAVPAGKQSAKADYERADLMVTTAATIGQYNTVSRTVPVHYISTNYH